MYDNYVPDGIYTIDDDFLSASLEVTDSNITLVIGGDCLDQPRRYKYDGWLSAPVQASIQDDVLCEDFECISINEATSMVLGKYWTRGYRAWIAENGLRMEDYVDIHAFKDCKESEDLCKLMFEYIDLRIEYWDEDGKTEKQLSELNARAVALRAPIIDLIRQMPENVRDLLLRIYRWDDNKAQEIFNLIDEDITTNYRTFSRNDKFDIFRSACNRTM